MFPTRARYLYVVRDGRDMALSTMQQPWGQDSPYACAKHWAQTCEDVESFRAEVSSDRFFQLRYEDLLREPERVTAELADFLGLTLDATTREALLSEFRESDMTDNFDKWKTRMSPASIRRFEAVAGKWLDLYGYERGDPGAEASWIEGAWFMGQEYARRVRAKLFPVEQSSELKRKLAEKSP
jgi:hypothetical protein